MIARNGRVCGCRSASLFETAATVWHNYGTAYYALVEGARAQHVKRCFVTGAAGGVGLAAVDLARHLGLRVIAGVGSDDKAGLVRGYGACDVINYRSEDLRERIKSITGGEASMLASTTSANDFRADGAADEVGWTADADRLHQRSDSFGANESPLLKNYSIVGVFTGAWAEKFPEQAVRMNEHAGADVGRGKDSPHIDRVFPWNRSRSDARRGQSTVQEESSLR